MVPFVGFVSAPQEATTLGGQRVGHADADITLRMISNGQPHRALPLTASLCSAVAARIDGTVVARSAGASMGDPIRIAMPSGVLTCTMCSAQPVSPASSRGIRRKLTIV